MRFIVLAALAALTVNCAGNKDTGVASTVTSSSTSEAPGVSPLGQTALCDIKGGAGVQLTPPFEALIADCDRRCRDFTFSNPNRSCRYGTTDLAETANCAIRGGAGAFLADAPDVTRGTCYAKCMEYDMANPNRVCTWGYIDVAPQGVCDVRTPAGGVLASFQGTRGQCYTSCESFANTARACTWAGVRIN